MATFFAIYPPEGTGGGGGSDILASGVASLASGTNSFTIGYDVVLASSIPPVFSFINTVDSSPIYMIGYISAFNTLGFTVKTNAATDTANYKIVYTVSGAV